MAVRVSWISFEVCPYNAKFFQCNWYLDTIRSRIRVKDDVGLLCISHSQVCSVQLLSNSIQPSWRVCHSKMTARSLYQSSRLLVVVDMTWWSLHAWSSRNWRFYSACTLELFRPNPMEVDNQQWFMLWYDTSEGLLELQRSCPASFVSLTAGFVNVLRNVRMASVISHFHHECHSETIFWKRASSINDWNVVSGGRYAGKVHESECCSEGDDWAGKAWDIAWHRQPLMCCTIHDAVTYPNIHMLIQIGGEEQKSIMIDENVELDHQIIAWVFHMQLGSGCKFGIRMLLNGLAISSSQSRQLVTAQIKCLSLNTVDTPLMWTTSDRGSKPSWCIPMESDSNLQLTILSWCL